MKRGKARLEVCGWSARFYANPSHQQHGMLPAIPRYCVLSHSQVIIDHQNHPIQRHNSPISQAEWRASCVVKGVDNNIPRTSSTPRFLTDPRKEHQRPQPRDSSMANFTFTQPGIHPLHTVYLSTCHERVWIDRLGYETGTDCTQHKAFPPPGFTTPRRQATVHLHQTRQETNRYSLEHPHLTP